MNLKLAILLSISLFLTVSFGSTDKNIPIRAKIITDNNVTLAYTKEIRHLSLLSGAFNEKEFSKLLSKISTILPINEKTKKRKFYQYFKEIKKQEYRIVIYGINKDQMRKIKTILDEIVSKKSDVEQKQYYAFTLSGEKRIYPYDDFLTPVIGYCGKLQNGNFTYLKGRGGVENYYDTQLTSQDNKPKDIHLTIDFDLQQKLEEEVFLKKVDIDADEVISIVIDPKSFDIKAIASSNRFNPKNIYKEDFTSLNVNAIRYLFDINDYVKPIQKAILREKGLTLDNGYKKFGFYKKSGIDLNYEKVTSDNLQVNLMQLLKMYTVFYSGGKIFNPSILKQENPKSFKQIISKENASEVKNTLIDFFKQMQYNAVTLNDGKTLAYINIKEIEMESKKYLQVYLSVDPKNKYEGDKVVLVDTPDDFPYIIVLSSTQSASKQSHVYRFFSKKTKNIKIGEIHQPLNKYQANNENGSEAIVEGIYKNKAGEYLIDSITSKGTETASCNACQDYNVETFKITERNIESINLRAFDIETYKPLK